MTGRNDACPCGGGKKYKKCCIDKDKPTLPIIMDNGNSGFTQNQGMKTGGLNIAAYTIAKFSEDETVLKRVFGNKKPPFIWTPSGVRALSTEEIINKVESTGVKVDQSAFLNECKKNKSAWEVSNIWFKQLNTRPNKEMDDFFGLAACILWERWNGENPSYQMLDDLIQLGYSFDKTENISSKLEVWWKAWLTYKKLYDFDSKTIREIDSEYGGTQCLFNWCQDFKSACLDASFKNIESAKLGITYCSEFLHYFGNCDDLLEQNFYGDLAEMYALSGDQNKGEQLMMDFISDHPQLARGYATLTWIMGFRKRNGMSVNIDEQIKVLEEAIKYPVVDAEDFSLKERIKDLREDRRKQIEGSKQSLKDLN